MKITQEYVVGFNLYYVAYRTVPAVGEQVWNGSGWETFSAGNWTTYAVAMADGDGIGRYEAEFLNVPAGDYSVTICLRMGSTPVAPPIDQKISGGSFYYSGAITPPPPSLSGLYISAGDLQARIPPKEFVEITDRTNSPQTTPDQGVIAAAIAAGESRLHMRLGRRFKLPLDATDAVLMGVIRPIVCDFAWIALYPRADMADKNLITRVDEWEAWLAEIRDGKTDLPASAPPPAASEVSQVTWTADGKTCVELP